MPTKDDRQVLDYGRPPAPSRLVRFAKAAGLRAVIGVVLFFAALVVPHPQGIWYFGHRPQWTVGIDSAGLTIGPYSDPVTLGWLPLLVSKLVAIALPVWLVWRFWFRPEPRGSAAG